MALDKDRLGDAIVDRIKALNPNVGAAAFGGSVGETELRTFWKAIAEEIIDEFIANAVVDVTVTGVTAAHAPGAAAAITAQPGTGGISS